MKRKFKPVPSATTITTWSNIFSSKPILKVLLPKLHLFDIINMARTERRLYQFYWGTKMKKVLCMIVERDLGDVYKASPLQFLGPKRNIQDIKTRDGLARGAKKCGFCSFPTDNLRSKIGGGSHRSAQLRLGIDNMRKFMVCVRCSYCCHLPGIMIKIILSKYSFANAEMRRIRRYATRSCMAYSLHMHNEKGLTRYDVGQEESIIIDHIINELSFLDFLDSRSPPNISSEQWQDLTRITYVSQWDDARFAKLKRAFDDFLGEDRESGTASDQIKSLRVADQSSN